MGRKLIPIGVTVVILAGCAGLVVWMFAASEHLSGSWEASLKPIWIVALLGTLATGALAGALMWLAFYSARRGYDERVDEHDGLWREDPSDSQD
jgi:hypothetical protein